VQLFAENAQEAYDLMIIAPRLAEHPDVLLPVLVCQDGFTITHSAEPVTLLGDRNVERFVGAYEIPNALLDLSEPTSQGPFAMPDYYYELRRQQIAAITAALPAFDEVAGAFEKISGRRYRAIEPYELDDADRALVCLGSTGGTVKDVVDELRAEGSAVGLLEVRSFRPFPIDRVRAALERVPQVAVLDRADSPGGLPPLFSDLAAALHGLDVELESYVYGLGGRDLHPGEIREVLLGRAVSGLPSYLGLRGEACLA
jgi:pyruvate ferredoxin oxidoreductase alpha subunit